MAFAQLLVKNHSKIAAFVLPTSVAAGFWYTANFGTSPFEDMMKPGIGGESRVVNVRLGTSRA